MKSFPIHLLWLTFLNVPLACRGENILVYGAIATPSIRISMMPYMEALADKGHNVTYVTNIKAVDNFSKHPGIHEYLPKKWTALLSSSWEEEETFYSVRKNKGMIKSWYELPNLGVTACENLYSDSEFVEWVKSSNFDLVIVESLVNECGYGLAHLFGAKLIVYCSTTILPPFNDALGFPVESPYISDFIFNFPPGNQMSFLERFVNAINPVVYTLIRRHFYLPSLEEITKKGLGLTELPSFADIEKNASLVMLTTHFSLDYPRSMPPNAILVGGAVVSKMKKPLAKDLKEFIDQSDNGFVYISFGSLAEFTSLEESVQQEFLGAVVKFSNVRFVWKSSNPIKADLPSHIFVTKWVPQQTLLAHPKIKAFITHAGMGSITEAIHFSVPMICTPIMAEQDLNARMVASRGAGIVLEIVGLKSEELEHAISEVLNNEKYRNGMTKMTELFNDRQVSPLENAVWWTEYILRHDDSNSWLRSPSVDQSWWIIRQIDVWITAFLIVMSVLIIFTYILYMCLRNIASLLRNNRRMANTIRKKTE
ncbi:unnamed protein product [Orchesella dallaii]|uniref:UDP-glucuronosyltransferase n=1 Tax=Orchesella dallaii TaxID=48710 RepID=A0ABP1RWZ7_9HEXA